MNKLCLTKTWRKKIIFTLQDKLEKTLFGISVHGYGAEAVIWSILEKNSKKKNSKKNIYTGKFYGNFTRFFCAKVFVVTFVKKKVVRAKKGKIEFVPENADILSKRHNNNICTFWEKRDFLHSFFLENLGFRVKTNLKNGNLPKPIHWAFFCINTKLWLFKIQDLFLELSKKCGQKVRSKNYKKTVILLIKSYIVWKIQYEKSIIKTFWQKKIVWKSLIEKIKLWKILSAKTVA